MITQKTGYIGWCIVGSMALAVAKPVDERTHLQRVFHHVGDVEKPEQAKRLELGKVVFYFDQKPLVSKGRSINQDERVQLELFFPRAHFKEGKITKEIQHVAGMYSVFLEQVATGVKCIISFDPQYVMFDYDSFSSISERPAVNLHFFNKLLLNKMKRSGTLLQLTSLKRPCIAIDCGHGGKDQGARSVHGVCEKDITLSIGLEVAQLLESRGFKVCMTRRSDEDVGLDERTSRANISDAALLVSIHANASRQPKARGIETFFLAPSLFTRLDEKPVWHDIVMKYYREFLYAHSKKFAHCVHHSVLDVTHSINQRSDRKVKAAASQILVGCQIPAALIEIGFLSHPQEAQLLADTEYQHLVAGGICKGIVDYYGQCVTQHNRS
ncbi:N-acetylmuramoyl-L-alanine amidase [Candidatus Dependentiae bacterium]|nr:N-acetylmuramoyl-L-alanine amidase [Candidatus Dependentiae bacterium]